MSNLPLSQKEALTKLLDNAINLSLSSKVPIFKRLELAQLSGKLQLMLEFDNPAMVDSSTFAVLNGQKIINDHLNLIN